MEGSGRLLTDRLSRGAGIAAIGCGAYAGLDGFDVAALRGGAAGIAMLPSLP